MTSYALVRRQADDPGLWFVATTAPEAYLQQALRALQTAVESDWIAFHRCVDVAINRHCTCGGSGPGDPDACLACRVYHDIVTREEP